MNGIPASMCAQVACNAGAERRAQALRASSGGRGGSHKVSGDTHRVVKHVR